eukprot:TCALIF_05050-PA protein Name:"Protein of unknown function" AED:0.34 eAED:0.34 QI:0/0/0/0.5/0/0/2/0/145
MRASLGWLLLYDPTQFAALCFQKFLDKWNICWSQSSPYHRQSNAPAERTVRSIKLILNRLYQISDLEQAFLTFGNTPKADGVSHAYRMFERILRTALPTTDLPHTLKFMNINLDDKRGQIHQRRNLWYDSRAHPRQPFTEVLQGG